MEEAKRIKYRDVKRQKRVSRFEEDRLSSLSDEILTDILSRMSIKSAAVTSALSHRWRHLWTNVTSFNFDIDHKIEYIATIYHILRQITTQKLDAFSLDVSQISNAPIPFEIESLFLSVIRFNTSKICFDAGRCFLFALPASLFDSRHLVSLKLYGEFELPRIEDFKLPNLKALSFDYLVDVPAALGTLIRSCPLLEDLSLTFNLCVSERPQTVDCVSIYGISLDSLTIKFRADRPQYSFKFVIDAPLLTKLNINGCTPCYNSVRNPSTLVSASYIFSGRCNIWAKSIDLYRGMSGVTCLEIGLNEVNFSENYLLCLLHCFPSIEHLNLHLAFDDQGPGGEQDGWVAPDSVPHCLINKLKTIRLHVTTPGEFDSILDTLAYFLSNGLLLEKLNVVVELSDRHSKALAKQTERLFRKSLFKLPRCSSSCDVVFSLFQVAMSHYFLLP